MTMEEFLALPEEDPGLEFDDGVVTQKMSPTADHVELQAIFRQVFNETIPWLRIERNYSALALVDAALLAVAWSAFQRRPLTPR